MRSLEKKSEPMLDCPMECSFPSFYVSGEQMPEIDKWEVDEEYEIKVKVKMTRYDSHTDVTGTTSNASLDVLAYEK